MHTLTEGQTDTKVEIVIHIGSTCFAGFRVTQKFAYHFNRIPTQVTHHLQFVSTFYWNAKYENEASLSYHNGDKWWQKK